MIEDPMFGPSQSIVSPLPPSRNNNVPAQSAPSAQESTPPSDTSGSSTTSSKPGWSREGGPTLAARGYPHCFTTCSGIASSILISPLAYSL